MIRFDFSKSLLKPAIFEKNQAQYMRVHEILNRECQSNQVGWWHLPFDEALVSKIRRVAKEVAKSFQNLVVLGIGGSSTGLKVLGEALSPQSPLKLFLLESPDPCAARRLLGEIDLSKTCFNVVSKSGQTAETLALFDFFREALEKKVGNLWSDHVIATTEEGSGKLYASVLKNRLRHFPILKNVGGRFSALSAVTLFPLACLGVNIEKILGGAQEALKAYGKPNGKQNPAYLNGLIHHIHAKKGKNISMMMIYCEALKYFGDWYSQLWAESLGKNRKGQTPVAAQGPQVQHSLAQLILDGPKDKVVTFIKTVADLKNPLGSLLDKESKASAKAFFESGVPSVTITLPNFSEETLGELLMFYQIQTAFTGHLMKINPYDQPAVERIKRLLK